MTTTQSDFTARVAHKLKGLHFVSTGACPGCSECGLPERWRIIGIPSGITLPRPFDSEDEALEELEDMREDHDVKQAGARWGDPGLAKLAVEQVAPTDEEVQSAGEGGFSWSACDCCGSSLGGNRYPAHGRMGETEAEAQKDGTRILHLEVCTDCLEYLANGTLPGEED